jgi:hypothetical protein
VTVLVPLPKEYAKLVTMFDELPEVTLTGRPNPSITVVETFVTSPDGAGDRVV